MLNIKFYKKKFFGSHKVAIELVKTLVVTFCNQFANVNKMD